MIFLRKTLPVLLAVLTLSILVRLPQLGRPLSKHHEFCTAISLRILQIWYDQGIEKFFGNPVMSYGRAADKDINNFASASGHMRDESGNYYYVSHPPFAYYFPYAIFTLLDVRPSVLLLQLINVLLHFLAALFVYFTVCVLSFNRARSHLHVPSLMAFAIYLFLPPTLWFQGNVYMSDMAVQVPFVIGVYISLKMIIRQKFFVLKYIFWYGVVLFIMCYTSWLGFFFSLGVLVYSLLHVRDIPGFRMLIWTTVIVSFFSLQLITYQYSQINGMEAYASEIFNRFLLRGSVGTRHQGFFRFFFSYFGYFKNLLYNYAVHYLLFYVLIFAFIYVGITRAKLRIVFSENGYRFLWLSVLPIVLLHLVFLNYSSHDFTVLYASLFFSVWFGIFYDKMKKSGAFDIRKLNMGVALVLVLLAIQYTLINLPGEVSWKGDRYDTDQRVGEQIARETTADDVVFLNQEPTPQVVFYAGKNILRANDEATVTALLKQRKQTRGVWFQRSANGLLNTKIIDLK